MTTDDVELQAESLRRLIRRHNYLYHVLDSPEVPDAGGKPPASPPGVAKRRATSEGRFRAR